MLDPLNPGSLKTARERHRLTVPELASLSGVSASQLYRIEGGMPWRLATARKLAKVFEVLDRKCEPTDQAVTQ